MVSAFPDLKNWNLSKFTVSVNDPTPGSGFGASAGEKPCAYTVFQLPPSVYESVNETAITDGIDTIKVATTIITATNWEKRIIAASEIAIIGTMRAASY